MRDVPHLRQQWARLLLAYVTGLVNQKLLLQNEHLAAKNRILRAHLPARMRLSDPERSTLAEIGKLLRRGVRDLLRDLDTKFCVALDVLRSSGIRPLTLPPRSPHLNSFGEQWVCSIRQGCLSKLILFGEASLQRALIEYIDHHHSERNHQGKGNLLLFPPPDIPPKCRTVGCRDRRSFTAQAKPLFSRSRANW